MEPKRKWGEEEAIPAKPVIKSCPSFLSHPQFRWETLHITAQGNIQLYEADTYTSPVQIMNKQDRFVPTGTKPTTDSHSTTISTWACLRHRGLTELSLITKDRKLNHEFLTPVWALNLHTTHKVSYSKAAAPFPFSFHPTTCKANLLPPSFCWLPLASIQTNSLPQSFSNESIDGRSQIITAILSASLSLY